MARLTLEDIDVPTQEPARPKTGVKANDDDRDALLRRVAPADEDNATHLPVVFTTVYTSR